jgi:hypothetical protein
MARVHSLNLVCGWLNFVNQAAHRETMMPLFSRFFGDGFKAAQFG